MSWVALAAVAAATGVMAQSSVTIYGIVDLGMSNNKTSTSAPGAVTTTRKVNSLAGAEGTQSGSRIGFRGTEDLGGGLRASFNLEYALDADNTPVGTPAAQVTNGFTTRTSALSLAGGFGSVQIGTYLNSFNTARGYTASIAGVAGGDFLSAANNRSALANRSTNALSYTSPNMSGFTVTVGAAQETNKLTAATAAANTQANGRSQSVAVSYAAGPLSAILVTGSAKTEAEANTATAVNTSKSTGTNLSVRYDLGFAVPYVMIQEHKTSNTRTGVANVAGSIKDSGYEIGSRFPMGAFTPFVTFSQNKRSAGDVFNVAATGFDQNNRFKTKAYQIGTTYDLSKRTNIYAAMGENKRTQNARVGGAHVNTVKDTGYAIGLRHQF